MKKISVFEQKRKLWVCSFVLATCLCFTGLGFSPAFKDLQVTEVLQLRGGVLGVDGSFIPSRTSKPMSLHGQPRVLIKEYFHRPLLQNILKELKLETIRTMERYEQTVRREVNRLVSQGNRVAWQLA